MSKFGEVHGARLIATYKDGKLDVTISVCDARPIMSDQFRVNIGTAKEPKYASIAAATQREAEAIAKSDGHTVIPLADHYFLKHPCPEGCTNTTDLFLCHCDQCGNTGIPLHDGTDNRPDLRNTCEKCVEFLNRPERWECTL